MATKANLTTALQALGMPALLLTGFMLLPFPLGAPESDGLVEIRPPFYGDWKPGGILEDAVPEWRIGIDAVGTLDR